MNDVLAFTNDGGLTWQESAERTNWMNNYNGHYRNLAGNYLIALDKSIYRLEK